MSLMILICSLIQTSLSGQTCTVNAGTTFRLCETDGMSWTLFGSSNDQNGMPLANVTWSVVSEPAGSAVSITNPNMHVTDVTNVTVVGQYVFQLSGTCPDGSGTAVDQVTYHLDPQVPVPNFTQTLYEFCSDGWISITNPDPTVTYSWRARTHDGLGDFLYDLSLTSMDGDSVFVNFTGGFGLDSNVYIILTSERDACSRSDTVRAENCVLRVADAGGDVVVCGSSWVKEPSEFFTDAADEYSIMGRPCGTMTWSQITGPSMATISYDPNDFMSNIVWTNLTLGTYEFEYRIDYGNACNTTTRDTVQIDVVAGQPCFGGFTNVPDDYSLCFPGADDTMYIDVRDFGLDPSALGPGDIIRWDKDTSGGTALNCQSITLPPDGTVVAAIPASEICSRCKITISVICAAGCSVAMDFEISKVEDPFVGKNLEFCLPPGETHFDQNLLPSGFDLSANGCQDGGWSVFTNVVSSSNLPVGEYVGDLGRGQLPDDLAVGVHLFRLRFQFRESDYPLYPPGFRCMSEVTTSITVYGETPGANAGSDAILPCDTTSVTLTGSNPNQPQNRNITTFWSFVSGPNVPTIVTPDSTSTMVTGLAGTGTYVFKYTTGNIACGFEEDFVTVVTATQPPAPPNAGPDSTICAGACINLYADPLNPGEYLTWSVSPSAGVTFSDIHDPQAQVCGLAAGTNYTFTLTATNGCGSTMDQVMINVLNNTVAPAMAGPDICLSSVLTTSFNMAASLPAGATGMWNLISVDGSILTAADFTIVNPTSPTTAVTLVNNSEPFSATFTWTVMNPGCQNTEDTVIVTRSDDLFEPPDDVLLIECDGAGTYSLDWNPEGYPHFYLDTSQYQGPAGLSVADPWASPTNISFTNPGEYLLTARGGLADCVDEYMVAIKILQSAPSVDAGPDIDICDNMLTFTMAAIDPAYGGLWSRTTGPGTWTPVDATDPTTSITVSDPGSHEFVWSALPLGGLDAACVISDTMIVNILPPTISAGSDIETCDPEDLILIGTLVQQAMQTWSFISGPATPMLTPISPGNAVRVSGFTQPGTYEFEYEVALASCSLADTMALTFVDPIADAGIDMTICDTVIALSGSTPGAGETATWRVLSGGGMLSNPNDPNATYMPVLYGQPAQLEYCVSDDALGCENCDTVVITNDDSFADLTLSNIQCDDNQTENDASDDIITFDLLVTTNGSNLTYTVAPSAGTVTPTMGMYGQMTSFQLNPGSAGAGNVTLTISDAGSTCTRQLLVVDPGACSASLVLEKRLASSDSIVQTGLHTYDVTYEIVVCNLGTQMQMYDLLDSVAYDDDITINSAMYAIDGATTVLPVMGPWVLADDRSISPGVANKDTFLLTVNVTLNLEDGGSVDNGDDMYTACGSASGDPMMPGAGEGLFNVSMLDVTNDGMPEAMDTACADLPYLRQEKSYSDLRLLDAETGTYEVDYTVTVDNLGGVTGSYDLYDVPAFDDDMVLTQAVYTLNGGGSMNLALPVPATGWLLADDALLMPGGQDIYVLTITFSFNLDPTDGTGDNMVTECGSATPGMPSSGEGLFNQSLLDLDDDGQPETRDTACVDVPVVEVSKQVSSGPTYVGPGNRFEITYQIDVSNTSSVAALYDLQDTLRYGTGATPQTVTVDNTLAPQASTANYNGANFDGETDHLITEMDSIAGGVTETYLVTVVFDVAVDLVTDESADCDLGTGSSTNTGLWNEVVVNQGVMTMRDTTCEEIPRPEISHEKTVADLMQVDADTWMVSYHVVVRNTGQYIGSYDLLDSVAYDMHLTVTAAEVSFEGSAATPLLPIPPVGSWTLALDSVIGPGEVDSFLVKVTFDVDLQTLQSGASSYLPCGSGSGGRGPSAGEGLFNLSLLDVGGDGSVEERDTACADIPFISHTKQMASRDSIVQTGLHTYDILYEIVVCNVGGVPGTYDLLDAAVYDDDITINSAMYAIDGATTVLPVMGPWVLADDRSISPGVANKDTFLLTVNVTLNLEDGGSVDNGDDMYTACGSASGDPMMPSAGEGLFNVSMLDVTNDGMPEAMDTACADLPYLRHEKSYSDLRLLDAETGTYEVDYTVTVDNLGGVTGSYDLYDVPAFDDDMVLTQAVYTLNGGGSMNLALPVPATGWLLADDALLMPGGQDIYVLTITFSFNLDPTDGTGDNMVTECGSATPGMPSSGEGLFNQSLLDLDDDGQPETRDTACVDVPVVEVSKQVSSGPTYVGPGNRFEITYQIDVSNTSSVAALYDLQDTLRYGTGATPQTVAVDNTLAPQASTANYNGANFDGETDHLITEMDSIAGGMTETYLVTVVFDVAVDLVTDESADCDLGTGSSTNTGLWNEVVVNQGVMTMRDTTCEEIPRPEISHEKTVADLMQVDADTWMVSYHVVVRNTGQYIGSYDLLDSVAYDMHLTVTAAEVSFEGSAATPLLPIPPVGSWTLALDSVIGPGEVDSFLVKVTFDVDLQTLQSGASSYLPCGSGSGGMGPSAGEGLFNLSVLDVGGDGSVEERDTACADIPFISHTKQMASMDSIVQTGLHTYDILYEIVVCNVGGVPGTYDLLDAAVYDDDITINSAMYAIDGATTVLPVMGPWVLADDRSISPGVANKDTFLLTVNVTLNLEDGGSVDNGDDMYTACGSASGDPMMPGAGEGLFNVSMLDVTNDGMPEAMDTACADLPYLRHEKSYSDLRLLDAETGTYEVDYTVTVHNLGGVTGSYDLYDVPAFDDDMVLTQAVYTLNGGGSMNLALPVPATGWLLADDALLMPGGQDIYLLTITFSFNLDPTDGTGDNMVTECGSATPGMPSSGEGLFNQSLLDLDDDGQPETRDTACVDVPVVGISKQVTAGPTYLGTGYDFEIEYTITVGNLSSVDAAYDLRDTLLYGAGVTITSVTVDNSQAPQASGANYNGANFDGQTDYLITEFDSLEAGQMERYVLTVQFSLDPSMVDAASADCDLTTGSATNTGLLNRAQVNMGVLTMRDSACVELPLPEIEIQKNVVGEPELISGNHFRLRYLVVASNTGTIPALYSLSDSLRFGLGASVTSVDANYLAGDGLSTMLNPGFDGQTDHVIVTDEMVAVGRSDSFEIVVEFDIDYGLLDDASADCDLTTGDPENTGLMNMAVLTSFGQEERDTACVPIPMCPQINCYTTLNTSLGPNCEITVEPGWFIRGGLPAIYEPFVRIEMRTSTGARIPGLTLDERYAGRVIQVIITIAVPGCDEVTCMTMLTVKGGKEPVIEGAGSRTVYCNDPFLSLDPASAGYPTKPTTTVCRGEVADVSFVADWFDLKGCENDTAKVILREWEVYGSDGQRVTAMDTIVVMRLPEIDARHIFCAAKDTVYCADTLTKVGPYITLQNLSTALCDTLYLIQSHDRNRDGRLEFSAIIPEASCGLTSRVDYQYYGGSCGQEYRVVLELKQACFGPAQGSCTVSPTAGTAPNHALQLGQGHWRCEFWVSDLDTTGPEVSIKGPSSIEVPTSSASCAAHTYIPTLRASDDWSGIKMVKAHLPEGGSVVLSYNAQDSCFESHERFNLPKREAPYRITYEVHDSCHNATYDTVYVTIKDATPPVLVLDKGATVSLTGKKTWLPVTDLDEGSYDNCEIEWLLARRSDWQEACIDWCRLASEICWISDHNDTIRMPILTDKDSQEVLSHYARTMEWLCEDGRPCAQLLYRGWLFDLMKYSSTVCGDHPYALPDDHFLALATKAWDRGLSRKFASCTDPSADHDDAPQDPRALLEKYQHIGGGWSDAVPFSCEDACGPVQVEVLAMDYWCNWSRSWTEVWVEDRTAPQIVQDVTEEESISCKTFKDERIHYPGELHRVSLAYVVDQAQAGEEAALQLLDSVLGGYSKAWLDAYGNYRAASGEIIDRQISLVDSICVCTTYQTKVRVYDQHHGYVWKDSVITDCHYDASQQQLSKGIIAVNCSDQVHCKQEVWSELDGCGQGFIFRKFKFWQGCPDSTYTYYDVPDSMRHAVDTIIRSQRIWVGNRCELTKYMFEVPADTDVISCDVTYGQDGNVVGTASPDHTGYAKYKLADDCRQVGIAHVDKVFKVVGGESSGCFKILRTWYFADWCMQGEPLQGRWWQDSEGILDSSIQTIMVRDTSAPSCQIDGPIADGGTIFTSACLADIQVVIRASDHCGVREIQWQLKEVSDSTEVVLEDEGRVTGADAQRDLTLGLDQLQPGRYKLKVAAIDACNNERTCEYSFVVASDKKPSPVCATSLTAKLTPWDTDQDGEVDMARAVVWANEYDQGTVPACQDTSVIFQIALIGDLRNPPTLAHASDSLVLDCGDQGSKLVRVWSIGVPSGQYDFCDVLVEVSADLFACPEGSMHQHVEHAAGKKVQREPDVDAYLGDIPADVGRQSPPSGSFILHQNRPNPWRHYTIIRFELPEASATICRIFDMHGRQIWQQSHWLEAGYQEIRVDQMMLNTAGALYYQVETRAYLATGKMIVLP